MITALIILGILTVFIIGFVQVYNRYSRVVKKIDFAGEYRNKFVHFANKYFQTSDGYHRRGDIDGELYVWLTMNGNKIQNDVGSFGVMSYQPAFQNYMINNYQIIINTVPKFREGHVENFDVGAVDDCLLRYIGYLEEYRKDTRKNVRNPIVWFREGFREVLSIPILIFNWFGIIGNQTVRSITNSLIYKILTGIMGLVTFVSGIVTIIVGYPETIEFVKKIAGW